MPPSTSRAIGRLTQRMRAEFNECPGLLLTQAQVCRLFQLEPMVGGAILSALIDVGFLTRDQSGRFRKV
jgi:hypothetical protein